MNYLSDAEYSALRGFTCPACKKKNCVNGESAVIHDDVITRDCECECCGAIWTEEYVLNGFSKLYMPKKENKP